MKKKLRILTSRKPFEMGKVFTCKGIIKPALKNIRIGGQELTYPTSSLKENLKYLFERTVELNKDSKVLETSLFDEQTGGFNCDEKLMTIIPLTEYLTCEGAFESLISFYKEDEAFVKECKRIHSQILKGNILSPGKEDNYFILVGGNTRFAELYLQVDAGEVENLDDSIPFSVSSLFSFKEIFPYTVSVNRKSSKKDISRWMAENKVAYDFFMLYDNTAFGRQNIPEKIFRLAIAGIVKSFVDLFYKGDMPVKQFIASQAGLFDFVGLKKDRPYNLYLLSSFWPFMDQLQAVQEEDSPLSRTGFFTDGDPWFSRKIMETIRRIGIISKRLFDINDLPAMKEEFFKSIGYDFYFFKIVDVEKMNTFLNAIAKGCYACAEIKQRTKSEDISPIVFGSFLNHNCRFTDFIADELVDDCNLNLQKGPQKNKSDAVYQSYLTLLDGNKELVQEIVNLRKQNADLKNMLSNYGVAA